MSPALPLTLTIGHSTHPIEVFVDLLRRNAVGAVVDVRSSPYSRYSPQFGREALDRTLATHGMAYHFFGRELGARSSDPACYVDGRVQYARLAAQPLFQQAIARVIELAQSSRVALMCAEKEPLDCHRTLLVGEALVRAGADLHHILSDGRTERHADALGRLLALHHLPPGDLFHTREQSVSEAMKRQEARIAFVDQGMAGEFGGDPA